MTCFRMNLYQVQGKLNRKKMYFVKLFLQWIAKLNSVLYTMYLIQGTAIKSESKRKQLGHDVTTTGCDQYLIKKNDTFIPVSHEYR